MRDFQLSGRSPVRVTEGMVATSHPLSTLAAMHLLRSGVNAMDAAVCAAAVQAVVEPQSTGISGDCFVLYCPKGEGNVLAFNGSGRAPRATTVDWYLEKGFSELPKHGPHAVTIPGAVDAWCQLLEHRGRKGLADALAPAMHYAESGYVVHNRVAFDWEDSETDLSADEAAARIFLPGGKSPKAGDVHRQPELAATLPIIAKKGRAGFYEGQVAEDIVGRLRQLGGLQTLDDFAATKGEYKAAISTSYRGCGIHQIVVSKLLSFIEKKVPD